VLLVAVCRRCDRLYFGSRRFEPTLIKRLLAVVLIAGAN
jgi:hypothetical protein